MRPSVSRKCGCPCPLSRELSGASEADMQGATVGTTTILSNPLLPLSFIYSAGPPRIKPEYILSI